MANRYEDMFRLCETTIADFGTHIAGDVELVALVKRPNGAGTIVSNLGTIGETIHRLEQALALTREAKRQLDAGVAEMTIGEAPPTTH